MLKKAINVFFNPYWNYCWLASGWVLLVLSSCGSRTTIKIHRSPDQAESTIYDKQVKIVQTKLVFLSVQKFKPVVEAIPAVPKEKWTEEKTAIRWLVQADKMLNIYQAATHSLRLSIFQIEKPASFQNLLVSRQWVAKALNSENIVGENVGILAVNHYIILPGSQKEIVLDRLKGVGYIGLVAAYFSLEPKQTTRLFQIPAVLEQAPDSRLGRVNVTLNLGPKGIRKMQVQAN